MCKLNACYNYDHVVMICAIIYAVSANPKSELTTWAPAYVGGFYFDACDIRFLLRF